MPKDYIAAGHKEGDVFTDNGKQVILQPDGTVRDANTPIPKPADYVNLPVDAPTAPAAPTAIDHGAVTKTEQINGGTQTTYADGWQTFAQGAQPGQSPAQPAISNAPPTDTSNIIYNPDGSRKLSNDQQAIDNYYQGNKPMTPEEAAAQNDKIRQEKLAQQQEVISGINAVYNNLLGQINQDNTSRMGSAASINALSGQRGSASGAATEDATRRANQDVVNANETERLAMISQARSKYKSQIDADILKARELRASDANAYLKYVAGKVDRDNARGLELRRSLIAGGIAPDGIDNETYQEMADAAGYTIDQAKAIYKNEYDSSVKSAVTAEEKRIADLNKINSEAAKNQANADMNTKENKLIDKGYVYISTPAKRDELIAQGRIMVTENGRVYAAPSTLKTKVITRGKNNILINSDTGDEIKNLGPAKAKATAGGKNYTATTIPSKIKADLLYDKTAGGSIDELMGAYPEVSTSYIQSLFAAPSQFNFSVR